MSVKNKTNKNYKRSQKGRSMVEMLGVLAIVGVLSAGGVYGYGVAMKKHKANELLHQASMLATTISAQAMTNDGNLPSTITSFGNISYGTFDQSVTEALDGKGFSITIKNNTADNYAYVGTSFIVGPDTYDNPNITFEIINMTENDVIESGMSKTFVIKFKFGYPLNLMKNKEADYIITGAWAKKAWQEAV